MQQGKYLMQAYLQPMTAAKNGAPRAEKRQLPAACPWPFLPRVQSHLTWTGASGHSLIVLGRVSK